jgi:pyruvate carboxylase
MILASQIKKVGQLFGTIDGCGGAGLADQWDAVKDAYAAANRALGNIVKVTPSSKVVGDLANFMVSNSLDEHSLVERAAELSFPKSVVEFMQGYLGQPAGGFPEPLRSRIMKDAKPIAGRPGASMPPLNMVALRANLQVLLLICDSFCNA